MVVLYFIKIICFFGISIGANINVLTTNDLHGFLGEQKAVFMNPNFPPKIIGSSATYKYVKNLELNLKNGSNDVLFLDGGNFFQGHPLGIADSGKTVIEWMNKIGYDALVPAETDFIFGYENLIRLSQFAEFPFLACNLKYQETNENIFDPYLIQEIDGVKIGVIGVVSSSLDELVLSKNIKGIVFENEIKSLKYWTQKLIDENVDAIILLSSLGVPWEREKVYNEFYNKIDTLSSEVKNNYKCKNSMELGYFCSNIDVVVSGGVSKGYRTPWYDNYSHTFIFQNYGNGTEFGHFVLNFKDDIFIGYNNIVTNSVTQTLFVDDFDYDYDQYDWINNKVDESLEKIYSSTNWNSIYPADDFNIELKEVYKQDNWDFPKIENEYKHNIATWNCEFFPTANDSTIFALAEAITDLDLDIIAFQEIKKNGWFDKLMKIIPQYSFIISKQSSFMNQAVIFKKDQYSLVNSIELFAENDYNFAGRPPLKCDFLYKENQEKISLINLHMKCCDSGLSRRKKASKMLYEYLEEQIDTKQNDRLIILGDWNDDLKDLEDEHCFTDFLNDDKYFFPTFDITYDIEQASYPKEPYVSFLDHILVTKSLVDINDYKISTIRVDEFMGSFDVYEQYISDHLPVLLSF